MKRKRICGEQTNDARIISRGIHPSLPKVSGDQTVLRSHGGIDGVTLVMGRWHTEGQTPKHLAWNREAQGLIPVTLPTSGDHWGKSCPFSELPFPQLQNIGGVDMLSKVPEISGARQGQHAVTACSPGGPVPC